MKKYSIIFFLFFIIFLFVFWLFDLTEYFSIEIFIPYRNFVVLFADEHWFLLPFLFISLYLVVTIFLLPISTLLTLIGGFIFPQPLSTIYVIIGATFGSSIVFVLARTFFLNFFKKKGGKQLEKIERKFHENGINYLLFLRLVPIFPFWLVNLGSAFSGISLRNFFFITLVGLIPAVFIYTEAGAQLGLILDSGGEVSFQSIFHWKTKFILLGLGFLTLIPIILKKLRRR